MTKIFSECFWSEASAQRAAARLRRRGYVTRVRFDLHVDGRSGWHIDVFVEPSNV
jgi:hypothetical protein